MDLTDKQFRQLLEDWIDQSKYNVKLCEPRGNPGSLTFYLQFEKLQHYEAALNYFNNKNVHTMLSTAHANRLQVYQWRPTRTP